MISDDNCFRPIFYSEFFMERIFAHQLQSSTASMSHMLAIQDSAQTFMLLVSPFFKTTWLKFFGFNGVIPIESFF